MKLERKLDGGDAAMLERASDTIVSQVEALRRLVDAFGDYAQEPEINRETIRLEELVREVVTLYQQGDAGLRFTLDLCPGPPGLAADSDRLRQMLHNLIRNAREASDKAVATIAIGSRVVTDQAGTWLLLEMRDDGPGFPDSVLEQPFEPYVTSKSHGRGLGLAICRKIASEHNGRISISNPPEGGARVDVLLPLNAAQAASQRTG
jgi:nitrogen fixation/metabolism regulation signal transduction histidine kinase